MMESMNPLNVYFYTDFWTVSRRPGEYHVVLNTSHPVCAYAIPLIQL